MPTRTPTRRGAHGRKRVSSKKQARPSKLEAVREALRTRLGRQADDVWGLILIVDAVLLALAFFDQAGPIGRIAAGGLTFLFGVWGYAVPLVLCGVGLLLILGRTREGAGRLLAGATATFLASLALFHLLTGTFSLAADIELVRERGGVIGAVVAFPLRRIIGFWGAFVVLAATLGMGVLVMTKTSVRELFIALGNILSSWRGLAVDAIRQPAPVPTARHVAPTETKKKKTAASHRTPKARSDARRPRSPRPQTPVSARPVPGGGYQLPPLELLGHGGGEEQNKKSLEETARVLEETLRQHGVDARLTRIVPGPTVTRYEIELAPGVKVNRVSNLSHDIAYALATPDVRLLVPIPGRSAIGVEVPNRKRRLVTLGDILRSPEAGFPVHPLEVALGIDINGNSRMLNLSDLPHLLIAGATGAGKSSCINSIVTSLLMRTTPDDVRLIMVDPKRVELGQYNGVPHLLTRVIANPKKAADALKWAVAEMDRRYDLLAEGKVRDIVGYREKMAAGELDVEQFDKFPYIVVIVDELNDLMMVAGRDVEEAVVRIAQMARAVGIHLVIATQRPSVDVITGVIKANIPSRLAFSVASQTDSRVIIDGMGAEKLVGMGDMLMVTAKEPRPQRIQGAWVRESEIHAVVEWVKEQREAQYQDHMVEAHAAKTARAAETSDDEEEDLVRQATELIVRSQLGSTSMLQRKLRVGFARAGRIMDTLEIRGIVGPSEGSKPRAVLITEEELEDLLSRS